MRDEQNNEGIVQYGKCIDDKVFKVEMREVKNIGGENIIKMVAKDGVEYQDEKILMNIDRWAEKNLLLFTEFDRFLEDKYKLKEGVSFKKHYENIPENKFSDKISKNCYRILRVIRNSIQHNIGSVNYNYKMININYCYNNILYKLQISKNGMTSLYTLIMNIMEEKIMDIPEKYRTCGHYEAILNTQYFDVIDEISEFSDDIGSKREFDKAEGLKLRAETRYVIEKPEIYFEDDTTIVFKHIEFNNTDNEEDEQYYFSSDYIYKNYILPQEIGKITKGKGNTFLERKKSATISFEKTCLQNKWKMPNL